MKKLIYILLISGLFFVSCDENEVAPIIDPSTYPLASFELADPNQQGATFDEATGGTITIDVMINKPVTYNTQYTAYATGESTAVAGEDFVINNLTIPAYSTSGQLTIDIVSDMIPETDQTVELVVKPLEGSDGEQNDLLFDPATEYLNLSFTIENVNSTTGLTMSLDWNEEQASDLDVAVFDANGNDFSQVASADVPEVGEIIPNTAPDGTYYVNIDDFAVEAPPVDYEFGFAEPNGEISNFTGSLDTESPDEYTIDFSAALSSDTFRIIEVVKSGSNYTISSLVN